MLAVVIGKYGTHPVDVFEAGPTITTFGAGVGLFGRTMDIMRDLGLYDEFIKLAVRPPQENTSSTFRKSDQRDGYDWFWTDLKHGQLMLHRKDVVEFLLQYIPASCKIHTSKKFDTYKVDSETGKITLHFSDGYTTVTDVLVGADGIHSATRSTMYKKLASAIEDDESRKKLLECIDPVWTGMLVYRSLIPTEKILKAYPDLEPPTNVTMHLGKDKHIVTFPVSKGKLINVVIFLHNRDTFGSPFKGRWVTDVPEEEVVHLFEGWDIRAEALAKCIEKPSRWALHSLRPLPHYVDGAVALLGDAAHAMEPHFGAGAGQAMEDAYVLGRLLTHKLTDLGNIADALKTYEEVRVPFANSIVQQTHDVARYYSFSVPPEGSETAPVDGTREELDYIRKEILDRWEWQNDPNQVWGDAEKCWRAKHTTPASPKL